MYIGGWNTVVEKIENIHVTTFKSAKGTEFDAVLFLILTKDLMIRAHNNINDSDYFRVGMTRSKRNLYLLNKGYRYNIDSEYFRNGGV